MIINHIALRPPGVTLENYLNLTLILLENHKSLFLEAVKNLNKKNASSSSNKLEAKLSKEDNSFNKAEMDSVRKKKISNLESYFQNSLLPHLNLVLTGLLSEVLNM